MGALLSDAGWAGSFEPFGAFHLVSVLVWLSLAALLVVRGRRLRGTVEERRWRKGLGWGLLLIEVAYQLWENLGGRYDPLHTLPLHACDLVAWCAVLALLTGARWPRTLAYFVGLGLSTQTFLTPTLHEGFADPKYWFFWASHTGIVTSGLYVIAVLGWRPGGRDFLFVSAVSLLYVGAVTPLNLALGANYGYVGDDKPGSATALDLLGPWPLRIFAILGLTLLLFAAMWLVPGLWMRRRSVA